MQTGRSRDVFIFTAVPPFKWFRVTVSQEWTLNVLFVTTLLHKVGINQMRNIVKGVQ